MTHLGTSQDKIEFLYSKALTVHLHFKRPTA